MRGSAVRRPRGGCTAAHFRAPGQMPRIAWSVARNSPQTVTAAAAPPKLDVLPGSGRARRLPGPGHRWLSRLAVAGLPFLLAV